MPRTFRIDQEVTRRGESEYITDINRQEKLVRRWLPAESRWFYTRAGLAFFRRRRVEYVVELPATVTGRRDNGTY